MSKFYIFFSILLFYDIVLASPTKSWEIEKLKQFLKGEFHHLFIDQDGVVSSGIGSKRIPFNKEKITTLWSLLKIGGKIFISTGNNGEIYLWKKGELLPTLFLKTEFLAVTSMVYLPNGKILLAGIPSGKIYSFDIKKRELKLFSELEVDNIWDMLYDYQRKLLFVATGSNGKLFTVDIKGNAQQYVQLPAKDIVTLDSPNPYIGRVPRRVEKGERLEKIIIWAGTSPQPQLIEIRGVGRFRSIASFKGDEVKGITHLNDDIYVIVNDYKGKGNITSSGTTGKLLKKGASKTKPKIKLPEPKSASVYRIGKDGEIEEIFRLEKNFFLKIVNDKKRVYASTGKEGRIISYDPNLDKLFLFLDLESEHIFDLIIEKDGKGYCLGSKPPYLYLFNNNIKILPYYLTEVFDSKFPSRWGRVKLYGEGRFRLLCRTGNTERPDKSWSDWIEVKEKIHCPSARYLQLKIEFLDRSSYLRKIRIFYRNFNQRARIKKIKYKYIIKKGEEGSKDISALPSTIAIKKRNFIKLEWEVENPDKDPLRYRLWYKRLFDKRWLSLTKPDQILTKKKYIWDISSIPSGYYLVKIEASDELKNGERFAKKDYKISPPIPIDNLPPKIKKLEIKKRSVLGFVTDNLSIIKRIDYNIDNTVWFPVEPNDFLYDSRNESFKFLLPKKLSKGLHILAIRVYDEVGNVNIKQIQFEIR